MSQTVVVSALLSDWPRVVFAGDVVEDGRHLRFVALDGVAMSRSPRIGETWTIGGRLIMDPAHGPQVRVDSARLDRPAGRVIVSLLSGGRFPGIGAKTAQRLWDRCGDDLYRMLDAHDHAALLEAFGQTRQSERQVATLLDGWGDLGAEIAVLAWLDRHAVAPSLASRITACFGRDAKAAIEEDPYRLCLLGAAWRETDTLGRRLRVADDDRRRLAAAVDHCLHRRFARQGDTWVPDATLRADVGRLIGPALAGPAVDAAAEDLAVLPVEGGWQAHGPAALETFVAAFLRDRLADDVGQGDVHDASIASWAEESGVTLNDGQLSAVATALRHRVALIIGGAGTGKTTVLRAIADLAERRNEQVILMALSGRAALRMGESTGRQGRTIAAFLGGQRHRDRRQKPPGLVIIDEASMLDVVLLYRIILALGRNQRLLLVGDVGQLPPIGPGKTLHELAGDTPVPKCELTEIVRQAEASGIPSAAFSVRQGTCPDVLRGGGASAPGVQLVACHEDDLVATAMALRDAEAGEVQIIASLKGVEERGAGTRRFNALLHARIAVREPELFGRFCAGEPVIVTRNDHDLGVMNGELGLVIGHQAGDGGLEIDFGDRRVGLAPRNLRDLELAYAVTVHKAQGSAFGTVIVPILRHDFFDRTLVYTALTRARHKAIFVGDPLTLERAIVAEPSSSHRRAALNWHLKRAISLDQSPTNTATEETEW